MKRKPVARLYAIKTAQRNNYVVAASQRQARIIFSRTNPEPIISAAFVSAI
tara:strand:+ start:138 stop:290 length:153 start_codon:yes stop_codon:yes gene_type:complete